MNEPKEDFPGLHSEKNMDEIPEVGCATEVGIDDLYEYCLDKQKVKEVIDSIWGKDSIDGNYQRLLKEWKL